MVRGTHPLVLLNTPVPGRYLARDFAAGMGFAAGPDMVVPPFDLLYLGSVLKKCGIGPLVLLDADAWDWDIAKTIAELGGISPSGVVATLCLASYENDIKACRLIHEELGLDLWLRGRIYDQALAKDVLRRTNARGLFWGENIMDFPGFLNGDQPGGSFDLDQGQLRGSSHSPVFNPNDLPIPDRSLIDHGNYCYPFLGRPFATIKGSWGCPYPCAYYCPYPLVEGKRWQGRSVASLIDEIEDIVKLRNIPNILFRDAVFTYDRQRILDLCSEIKIRGLVFNWWCESRFDRLDEELIGRMAQSGLKGINVGLETADPYLMQNLAKPGLTLDQVKNISKSAFSSGVDLHLLLMVGLPGETRQTIANTFDYLVDSPPKSFHVTPVTPMPGTVLFKDATKYGWIQDQLLDHYDKSMVVMRSSNLSVSEIEEGIKYLFRLKSCLGLDDAFHVDSIEQLQREIHIWAEHQTYPINRDPGEYVMVRIDVANELCTSCGYCWNELPDIFGKDHNSLAFLQTEKAPDQLRVKLITISDICPGECIFIT